MFRSYPLSKIAIALALAAAAPGLSATSQERQAQQIMDQIPLYFEANRGQVDSRVLYLSRSPEHTLFLTVDEAVLKVSSGALRMSLVNANPAPEVAPLDALESHGAYFVGKSENWLPRVEHYGKVRYSEVYPGVDLVFYGHGKQIEHDFVVAPGTDPRVIRFRLDGAGEFGIGDDGALEMRIGESRMRFSAPYSYVESEGRRIEVASRFERLAANEFGFAVGAYDRSKTLVIDPVLSYSSYLGGSNFEVIRDVVIDSAGFIILAGETVSEDFPTNGPGLQPLGGQQINGFVTKLNPFAGAGQGLIFSGHFGGFQNETVNAMKIDSQDNLYVVGMTLAGDFPTTGNAVQAEQPSRDQNGYLVKFNLDADPALLYGTYLGGDARDVAFGLAVEADHRAYVTGFSASGDFPLTATPLQPAHRGAGDAFFTLVDTDGGGLIYSSYLGGTNTDFGLDVAVASEGAAFVTGFTNSGDFPINENPYQPGQQGKGDAFLTRIDWQKEGLEGLGYSSHLGGSDLEYGQALVKDPEGSLHVLGYTLSEDFPTTAAAIQSSNEGNADVFLLTIDPTKPFGEGLLYGTYFGGSGADVPYQMEFDSTGSLVITGYTMSSDMPVTGDYYSSSYSGLVDAFFAVIDPKKPAGEGLRCSSFLGGSLEDVAWGMTVDALDNFYLVGQTRSRDFPVTDNSFQNQKPGGLSGFVSKFGPCASPGGEPASAAGPRRMGGAGQGRPSRAGGSR